MTLQQSSTLCPLPRELVVFAVITRTTSKNNVTHIVSRNIRTCNTTNRECMLYMVFIFPLPFYFGSLKFGMSTSSIIASVLLSFELLRNLSGGMGSLNGFLPDTAGQSIHFHRERVCLLPVVNIATILLFLLPLGGCYCFTTSFLVSRIVCLLPSPDFLAMPLISLRIISLGICSRIGSAFLYILIVAITVILCNTFLASTIKSTKVLFCSVEVLRCSRIGIVTAKAFFLNVFIERWRQFLMSFICSFPITFVYTQLAKLRKASAFLTSITRNLWRVIMRSIVHIPTPSVSNSLLCSVSGIKEMLFTWGNYSHARHANLVYHSFSLYKKRLLRKKELAV